MFEVTSTRSHAAMQTFVPDRQRRRSSSLTNVKASSTTRQRALGPHRL